MICLMPEYAPPNGNISAGGILLPQDNMKGLSILYREVKTMVVNKTKELIELGLTDQEIQDQLQVGKILLPTGDTVGILTLLDTLGPIFEPSSINL